MRPVIFSVHFKPSFVVLVSWSIIFTSSQSSTYLLLVFFRCFLFNVWNNQQTDIDRLNTLKLHTRVYCSLVAENTHLILLYLHCSCSLSSGTRLEGVRLPAWQTDKSFLGREGATCGGCRHTDRSETLTHTHTIRGKRRWAAFMLFFCSSLKNKKKHFNRCVFSLYDCWMLTGLNGGSGNSTSLLLLKLSCCNILSSIYGTLHFWFHLVSCWQTTSLKTVSKTAE